MKRLALTMATLCVFATAVSAGEILDGVAAIANDRVITYSEVRDYVQPIVQQLRRNYSGSNLVVKVQEAQMDALNNLIERALIIQEFKDKGYSIPETVIDEQLNDVIANDFGGDRTTFIKTLQAQNMTVAQYRDQLRDRVIVQAMRNSKTQKEVVISPYKIEKYYRDHQDDFKVDEEIKVRMIFIKKAPSEATPAAASGPPTSATTQVSQAASAASVAQVESTSEVVQAATTAQVGESSIGAAEPASPAPPPPVDPRRELGDEIVAKLDEGASFESMARLYSEAKEAKAGGDWGWIGHDVLRKELNEVAFTLTPGQHSQLIDTAEGYYILQVDDVKPAHVRPLAEVRDEIEKILLQQQRTKMQENWVKDLRAKAYIRLF
jgi:peptidyl-prolyl cis-trans isomerase SurA